MAMSSCSMWTARRAEAFGGSGRLSTAARAPVVARRLVARLPSRQVPSFASAFAPPTNRAIASAAMRTFASRANALASAAKRRSGDAAVVPHDSADSFAELGLDKELVAATDAMGLTSPTEIQTVAIPKLFAGGNFLVASQTGSGKTLAYLLPVIHRMRREEAASGTRARAKRPRVLIVGPTRELVEQVRGVAKTISHHARFSSEIIIGGEKFATQRQQLDRPLDVVVGTPGRLIKHMEEENLFMSNCTHIVLDEADTLFEAGFGDEIKRLLRPLKKDNPDGTKKTVIVVSATMSQKVIALISEELTDLVTIDTPSLHKSPKHLKHRFVDCPGSIDKMAVCEQIVMGDFRAGKKTMVFCNTMPSCQAVEYALTEADIPVVMYNGDMTVEGRQASMKEFTEGDFTDGSAVVMVCTDLAARGLDFGGATRGQVEHVLNFDFPMNPVDYIHRSGRTARAGATGKVTNLVAKKDRVLANEIDLAVKLGNPLDAATSSRAVADARARKETQARKMAREARFDGGRGDKGRGGGRGGRGSRGGRGGRGRDTAGVSAGRARRSGTRGAARNEEGEGNSAGGRGGGRGGRGRG